MTPLAVLWAGSWAYLVFRLFRRLGVFGLLLLSALDSSFLFLPFGNDLMLIALVSSNRSALMAVGYFERGRLEIYLTLNLTTAPFPTALFW